MRIIGTNHCCNTYHEELEHLSAKQDMLCLCGYAERVVASFSHQIQSEYYGGNIYVSIEGIALEHFIAPTHTEK